jgi:hypothetical protein
MNVERAESFPLNGPVAGSNISGNVPHRISGWLPLTLYHHKAAKFARTPLSIERKTIWREPPGLWSQEYLRSAQFEGFSEAG